MPIKNPFKKKRKPYARKTSDIEKLLDPKKIEAMKLAISGIMQAVREERQKSEIFSVSDGDDTKIYLYDFERSASFNPEFENNNGLPQITGFGGIATEQPIAGADPRKVVKPIDVVAELQTVPKDIQVGAELDMLIAAFESKKKLIRRNDWAKNEVISMITRLKNRKRYAEFKTFFDQFQNTTAGAVQELLGKYKLVLKTSDLFVPDFPKEAIELMEQYEANTLKLCELKPVFYVIAEESNFKEIDKKRDPILLAQSPFGIYYQILGAWDKEMLLLSEL